MKHDYTILIVDDEKTNVKYVSDLLGAIYNLKVAYNGKQALNIVNNIQIDLILLDIQMPIMDGYAVIKELKNNSLTNKIPVIFLTSSKDNDTLKKVFEVGAHDYISKPFNTEELKIRVDNHLTRYRLQKESLEQQTFLNLLINSQSHMIFLINSETIKFINKYALNFFNYKTIKEFKEKHNCICDFFIENDRFFNLGKIKDNENWIEYIQKLPQEERIVSILGKDAKPHSFTVSITKVDNIYFIISLTDISQTIVKHIELEEKVVHDKLTGAFNREYFEQNYQRLIDEYKNDDNYLGLALLDIDHFKIVNDTHGHDTGDRVLIQLVDIIKTYSRENDFIIRWGGEEFILIFKVSSLITLEKATEHLRAVIEIQDFDTIGKMTCSIGATLYKENEDIEKTIKRADEAVYEAKEHGRNIVVVRQ